MQLENSMHAKTEITIENVVATAGINQEINIKKTIKAFSDVKYNPKKFPGAIIKLQLPKATILLFRTGNIVCTGTKSEENAKDALAFFVAKLEESGIDLIHGLSDVKIQNIASSCNLNRKIHLEKAAKMLPRSLYEPEQFPGIVLRIPYPKTVILLFASGKLVCTGAKVTSDIYLSVNTLHSMLEEKNLMKLKNKDDPV
jgi:transcription initiation factor TFIID TATA-box-binding protein